MEKYRFNDIEREVIYRAYKRKCFYCGLTIGSIKALVIDHLIPEHLFDKPKLRSIMLECDLPCTWEINSYSNWVPAHYKCNKAKGNKVYKTNRLIHYIEQIERVLPVINKIEKQKKKERVNNYAKKHKVRLKDKWDFIAANVADFVTNHIGQAHCGALLFDQNITAVFGNYGYELGRSQKVKNKVTVMLVTLAMNNYKTLGFGVSKCKYSYCILVETNNVKLFHDWAWSNNPFKGSRNSGQYSIASVALSSYRDTPLSNYFIN